MPDLTTTSVIDTFMAANDLAEAQAALGISGGATNIWVDASSLRPKVTAGPGIASFETATYDQNFDTLDFDAFTTEYSDFCVVMPSNYAFGTITARFFWTAESGSGTVIWGISARAFADGDALDSAAGTAQTVTDTFLGTRLAHISGATPAVTIAGTPAANCPVQFTVYRNTSGALAVDAKLIGVEITFA